MRKLSDREEAIGPDGRPMSEQPRWRQDFPIDTAEDNYVSRRDFAKFLVLTSGAFVVGQLTIAGKALIDVGRIAPSAMAVVKVDQLPVGAAKAFAYPGPTDACLLVRLDEVTFVAFSQECTHLSCAVVPEPDKHRFFCPCHNGSFDIATGVPTGGPPRRPLPRIVLEERGGTIYATGVELRTI